jgi:hypothetical protein
MKKIIEFIELVAFLILLSIPEVNLIAVSKNMMMFPVFALINIYSFWRCER